MPSTVDGMGRSLAAVLVAVGLGLAACSSQPLADLKTPSTTTPAPPPSAAPATPRSGSTPAQTPRPAPRHFDADAAFAHVRHLAGDIGPRLATGPAFRDAAEYVGRRLARSGYDVRRQPFPVPAGDSWGVPVEAGRSFNVIATPPGLDPASPYVLVGAHLDTVAVAPGAEDNASGVAVLLEVARVLRGSGPVVLVAFGGEEPRGPGALHHFGSRRYVAAMSPRQRRHLRAMASLDRVGVGSTVPVAAAPGATTAVRDELARTARRLGIPARVGVDDASDHESFADAGLAAARLGSTPYAAYHSADDLPRVVSRDQLGRVGRLLLGWLRAS